MTLQDVKDVMAAAQTRAGGEAAARDIAKLLMDARNDYTGRSVLEAIAAPTLAESTRDYLIQDYELQRQLGAGRHYEFVNGAYYRSTELQQNGALRVNLEISAELVAAGWRLRDWYVTRYDVVWVAGVGWRLVDFSDGHFSTRDEGDAKTLFPERDGWRPLVK